MLYPTMNARELSKLNTLALAQVGDAVFELMVRTKLCLGGVCTAEALHRARVGIVNATAQARLSRRLDGLLDDEEAAVFRRGRNAQVGSVPRAASRADYGAATALESLLGWLYLSGKTGRLAELFEVMTDEQDQS